LDAAILPEEDASVFPLLGEVVAAGNERGGRTPAYRGAVPALTV
jgi:hypothetical protein